jgi:hypothetical protein
MKKTLTLKDRALHIALGLPVLAVMLTVAAGVRLGIDMISATAYLIEARRKKDEK